MEPIEEKLKKDAADHTTDKEASVDKGEGCSSSVGPKESGYLQQTVVLGLAGSVSTPNRRTLSSSSTNASPCKRTVIYSSPLLIPTNVQAVQCQQPLCYGSSPVAIPAKFAMENSCTYGQETVENLPHHPSHITASQSAHQKITLGGHSAFGKPVMCDRLQNLPMNVTIASNQLNFQQQYSAPVVYQSPSYTHVHSNSNRTHQSMSALTMSPSIFLKENTDPNHRNTMSPKPLSQVQREIVASSPRVLQMQNGESLSLSPSVARQRLIEEKRARLAQLRAQKEELRQRIKQDNEKVIKHLFVLMLE